MTTTERACPNCTTTLSGDAQFCSRCGTATPTDPGVPPRTQSTGAFEVAKVASALAGRYKIERVVGEGGMATVYLAEDQKHRRKVAVKVMRPELAATMGADRFLREVEIAAQLNHPNVLAMYDSGEANGQLYYVMPYVDGETLKERLEREGALAPDEALRFAREIAEALAYAHKRGIVHRDIKPANILVNEGHALVADFGIARALEDGAGAALTKTGLAVGTPQYMAPEQAAGERDIDGRADIYAAGAILYEMLAGQPPFVGQNARAILTKSLTERPMPLGQLSANVPPAVDAVVQKALAKSADERYATATEFMAALDGVRTVSSASFPALTPAQATQVLSPLAGKAGGLRSWLSPRNLIVAGLAALVLILALRGRAGGGAPAGNRMIVLPFHAVAGQEDYFLVEGLSEDVRARLSRISGLRVIASGTSNQFRESKQSPEDIARELGADYVLTAEARRGGDGAGPLTLVPQLRDARRGTVRWEEPVDLSGPDIAAAPSRIAEQVAAKLGVTITGEERKELDVLPTTSADAYRAYLRGSSLVGTDPGTLRQAIQQLEQAVALDSAFATAWSLLSGRYSVLYSNSVDKGSALARRAKEALDRAERLAAGAMHVRRARVSYLASVVNDVPGSTAELDGMLRVTPNDPTLLARSANGDLLRGELGASLAKLERARDLDPRSRIVQRGLVNLYMALDRAPDAIVAAEAMVSIAPLDVSAAQGLAMSHLANRDLAGARAALQAAVARGIPALKLGVQMAGYWEIGFALSEPDQEAVLRLTPSAFDDSEAWWAQSLATLLWQRGDTIRARVYADSALAPSRRLLVSTPDDIQMHGIIALMLSYLGRSTEARAEVERSLAIPLQGSNRAYNLMNASKAELALGNRDAALGYLKQVRPLGMYLTNGWLHVDPTFASLVSYPPAEAWMKEPTK